MTSLSSRATATSSFSCIFRKLLCESSSTCLMTSSVRLLQTRNTPLCPSSYRETSKTNIKQSLALLARSNSTQSSSTPHPPLLPLRLSSSLRTATTWTSLLPPTSPRPRLSRSHSPCQARMSLNYHLTAPIGTPLPPSPSLSRTIGVMARRMSPKLATLASRASSWR